MSEHLYETIETRVSHLEADMRDVKATLVRLEPLIVSIHAQMPYLATKAELAGVRADTQRLHGEAMTVLATKPGRGEMWMMAIALFALVVAAMAAGAIYLPLVERLLRASG
jgi:hypothetical protein